MSADDHDRAFFLQMATCREPYRRLADAIHAAIGPAFGEGRILDVGAGLGFVAGRLGEMGWQATALDPYAPEDLRDRGCAWLPFQLLDVPWWGMPGNLGASPGRLPWPPFNHPDVAICTETAEHIDASAADTIVANVAGCARHLVVWSAAQPGQEWPGHVNLQEPAYWLAKFRAHGFEPFEAATLALRDEMVVRHAQHEYAASNFFILSRVT